MGYIVDVSIPEKARIVVPLDSLEFLFDEEKAVAVIKKKPLVSDGYMCGARHWYRIRGPWVVGGFKLNKINDNRYERLLPFGKIVAEKDNKTGKWRVKAEGHHIFVPRDKHTIRPARSGERPDDVSDAWIAIIHRNEMKSRTCYASVVVTTIKGEAHVEKASTSCRIDSGETAVVIARNGTVYRVCYERGEYRGECWDECKVMRVVVEEQPGEEYVRLHAYAAIDEIAEAEAEIREEDVA